MTIQFLDVRLSEHMSGVVNILRPADVIGGTPSLRLFITRDGDGTPESGTLIYEMFFRIGTLQSTSYPMSITASDLPSSSVVNQGQIRYSLFINAFTLEEVSGLYVQGPVAFNGIAVAGSN